jgi:hypothetical protein
VAVIEVGPHDRIEDELLNGLVNGEHARQPLERGRASFAGRSVQFAEKRPAAGGAGGEADRPGSSHATLDDVQLPCGSSVVVLWRDAPVAE